MFSLTCHTNNILSTLIVHEKVKVHYGCSDVGMLTLCNIPVRAAMAIP